MKQVYCILISFGLLFNASFSSAQQNKFTDFTLLYKNQKTLPDSFLRTSFLSQKPLVSFNHQVVKPFDSSVHYTAFFCKMEVRNLERYHVWIKFHAGDYDRYK
jgi:hypothetical protein